jgi:hypothetical protein
VVWFEGVPLFKLSSNDELLRFTFMSRSPTEFVVCDVYSVLRLLKPRRSWCSTRSRKNAMEDTTHEIMPVITTSCCIILPSESVDIPSAVVVLS